jgi:adenylate cyclase
MSKAQVGVRPDRLRRAIRQIGVGRLMVTLLFVTVGLFIARFSWQVPLASDAERGLYDLRFSTTAEVERKLDQRIALVVYNDATLEGLRKRSPLDRGTLARALTALDQMGPRAIGIDILIDQPQDEDAQLIKALRGMRTPTFLAFASNVTNPDQMEAWQTDFLKTFLGQIGSGSVKPASIRLEADLADGVIRRWPRSAAGLPPLLAKAMTAHPEFRDYTGSIDFRVPTNPGERVFPRISIETIAQLQSEELPKQARAAIEAEFARIIRGREVLIGGEINGYDDLSTPMTRFGGGQMKGLEVHAQILAQQLDGRMRAHLPDWALLLAALLMASAGALTGLLDLRSWKLALLMAAQAGVLVFLPFQLQAVHVETIDLPAFGWGVGWLFAFLGTSAAARAVGSEQRRFAQSALGKYLPPDVANQIIREPERLALNGEKAQIYALFTDLEGFTKLSHAISPEVLSRLLNRYLDLMSDIVLEHGGTLDKFVGDALVSFWGAPIARPDDPDRAILAGLAMYRCGEEFRRSAKDIGGDDLPPIGSTRVGLHLGDAVVGNFGGKGRIQYTALGDAMNTAARLESANKALKTTILVSDEAKSESRLALFRPMGRIVLSGRGTPVIVWEPVPAMDEDLRGELDELWCRFDAGDLDALIQLETLAAARKDDAALQYFVYRIGKVGPGGQYVLESK